MATFTHKCPHCLTEQMGLRVSAGHIHHMPGRATLHLDCPKCGLPSCTVVKIRRAGPGTDPNTWNGGIDLTENWEAVEFWPAAAGPLIPEELPPDVERVYLQAERNFPTEGNEEAAGTMYRKALDIGLKKLDPNARGTLAQRIKKLADAGKLTIDIAEWANQIRELGNEAVHDESPPTRAELTDLRNFSEMAMRYLFSMPALVASRRDPPP
jgi:hypothetical protein